MMDSMDGDGGIGGGKRIRFAKKHIHLSRIVVAGELPVITAGRQQI